MPFIYSKFEGRRKSKCNADITPDNELAALISGLKVTWSKNVKIVAYLRISSFTRNWRVLETSNLDTSNQRINEKFWGQAVVNKIIQGYSLRVSRTITQMLGLLRIFIIYGLSAAS